jgi:hypothetical protein
MSTPLITRRNALLTALFGSGLVGLRALATGLPAWFLVNPRKATAQSLACAINAKENLQYLIVSVSSMGDPISCNCPGTYEGPAAAVIHPQQPEMTPAAIQLGSKSFQAAQPWSKLSDAVRARTAFFHHVTLANNHGDQPKVMRLMGATSGGEMLVSAYAKHLAGCFSTVQPEPVAVGAGGNASELISYSGRSLPSISPTQLRQLLTGSSGGCGGPNVLVKLRPIRDKYLDQLNALAKSDATGVQKQFLDALAASQTQVRKLADSLSMTLASINGDDVKGQALAAAALISANVTPVVTMRIPFGGDNHSDGSLQNEVNDHIDNNNRGTGVAGIQAVMDALSMMSLTDKVTFATLNVFGRNLNLLAKTESRSGRDHYGNHSVCVMIGKNVAPGVIGGVMPVSDHASNGALGAADIDSTTGVGAAGGDIPRTETHVAMARTLGGALGIPASALDADFVQGSGGKLVASALTRVPA